MQVDFRPYEYRAVWEKKPVLRRIYESYHQRIIAACNSGLSLEIGAGSGHFKDYKNQNIISIDLLSVAWLDTVADAQKLPFKANSFDNIILLDVLHHIEQPKLFFDEAQRILKTHGRIIMIEPGITPVSWFFYHYFHQEPVLMSADPLAEIIPNKNRDAYDSNQAIPTLLFSPKKRLRNFSEAFPKLKIRNNHWLDLFVYPMTGGFKRWQLLPAKFVKPLLKLESWLLPLLGPSMAFRLFLVLEKES